MPPCLVSLIRLNRNKHRNRMKEITSQFLSGCKNTHNLPEDLCVFMYLRVQVAPPLSPPTHTPQTPTLTFSRRGQANSTITRSNGKHKCFVKASTRRVRTKMPKCHNLQTLRPQHSFSFYLCAAAEGHLQKKFQERVKAGSGFSRGN